MIENDVRNTFNVVDTIDLGNGNKISVEDFCELFKNAKSVTYSELVNVENGKMGYIPFFDECKEQGILK